MAPFVQTFQVTLSADQGGVGISRFHVAQSDGTEMPNGPAGTVGAAIAAMYSAIKQFYPIGYNIHVENSYTVLDVASANVVASLGFTPSPANVVGTGDTNYASGTGARGYWHTGTVKGRRIIRGATYFTPLCSNAFGATGSTAVALQTQLSAAMLTYVTTLTAATLVPMVYSRPKKGATVGGVAAPITGTSCGPQPGSLRSRRS